MNRETKWNTFSRFGLWEDLQGNITFRESFMVCCKTHQPTLAISLQRVWPCMTSLAAPGNKWNICETRWDNWSLTEPHVTLSLKGLWRFGVFKPTASGFSYEIYNEFIVEGSNEHQYCIRFEGADRKLHQKLNPWDGRKLAFKLNELYKTYTVKRIIK